MTKQKIKFLEILLMVKEEENRRIEIQAMARVENGDGSRFSILSREQLA